MIVIPQLYQHEILYKAHGESGHQGVGKGLAKKQESYTLSGIKRDVVNQSKHCLIFSVSRRIIPLGILALLLQSINSSSFNDLVQFDFRNFARQQEEKTDY